MRQKSPIEIAGERTGVEGQSCYIGIMGPIVDDLAVSAIYNDD